MLGGRNKHAWIWVALAAISFAYVSPAATRLNGTRAYANPVLHFLVKSHSASAATSGAMRLGQRSSLFRDARSGAWIAVLPVWFIGLVLLRLFAPRLLRALQLVPVAPLRTSLFQRPPPVLV
jgi:hypothetical protein